MERLKLVALLAWPPPHALGLGYRNGIYNVGAAIEASAALRVVVGVGTAAAAHVDLGAGRGRWARGCGAVVGVMVARVGSLGGAGQ